MRASLGSRLRGGIDGPSAALAAWLVFTLAVQRWPSWEEGIRVQFAADTQSYEQIARAAPSLPDQHILRPFAERFPTHWTVGVLSDLTGVSLHVVYRIASVACVLLILLVVQLTLQRLRLDTRCHLVALGALAASAYPVHYLLAAPGMLSDGVFLLGLAVALLGFTAQSPAIAVAGLGLAALGRQSAVPVGIAAAVWVLLNHDMRSRRWRWAALCALVPGVIYVVLHFTAEPFATPEVGGLHDLTVLGFFTSAHALAAHLGRVVLGLAVPLAVALGAWWRTRGRLLQASVLLATAVALQPVVLGPSSNGSNEPRLAGLAAPALAVAAAAFLQRATLGGVETIVLVVAIAIAGLHHRYTHGGLHTNVEWATVELTAALLVLVLLARPGVALARRTEKGA